MPLLYDIIFWCQLSATGEKFIKKRKLLTCSHGTFYHQIDVFFANKKLIYWLTLEIGYFWHLITITNPNGRSSPSTETILNGGLTRGIIGLSKKRGALFKRVGLRRGLTGYLLGFLSVLEVGSNLSWQELCWGLSLLNTIWSITTGGTFWIFEHFCSELFKKYQPKM